jgi:hypothetical protein
MEGAWPEVVEVSYVRGHVVHVRFDDGASGDLDLSKHLDFRGVFAPLRDPAYVAKVRVDEDGGTIAWPNEADIDPVVLYHYVTGKPMPQWAQPRESGPRRS